MSEIVKAQLIVNAGDIDVLAAVGNGDSLELLAVDVISVDVEGEEILQEPVALEHPRGSRYTLDGHLGFDEGLSIFVRVDATTGRAHAHSNMEIPPTVVNLGLKINRLPVSGVA